MLNSMISLDPEILKLFKNHIMQSIPLKYAENISTCVVQILAKI